MSLSKRWCNVAVFCLICLAVSVSSRALNADPIYGGEYHSVRHTGVFESVDSIAYTFNSVATTSPDHAPFYFVFMYHWVRLVGVHPVVLRALSLLAFAIGVAVSYRVGSAFLGRVGGLFTAFMFTVSAYAVFYSHEVRMYVFMPSFSLAIIYFYWSIISAKKRVRWYQWVGLFLSSLLAIYVHYSSIFVLLSIGLYHLLFAPKNLRWVKVAVVEVVAGLLFAPWLPVVFSGSERLAPLSNSSLSITEAIYHILFVHSNGLWFVGGGLILLALLVLRHRQSRHVYLLVVCLGAIGLMLLFNEFIATVLLERRMRYTLTILPFLSLVFVLGLMQLWHWSVLRPIVLLVLTVWAGAGVWFYQSDEMVNYTNREAFRFLEYPPYHLMQPLLDDLPGFGEPVLSAHPTVDVELPILLFYSKWTGREFNHLFNETDPDWIPRMVNRLDIIEDDEAFLMVYDPQVTFPQGIDLHETIIESFKFCNTIIDQQLLHIDVYVRQHISCELFDDVSPVQLEFENGLHLDNLVLEKTSSSEYSIFSLWSAENVTETLPLSFTIQILNEDSLPVLASDYYMPSKSIGFNDLDLSSLLPGTYQVQIRVWDIESGNSIKSRDLDEDSMFTEYSFVVDITISS